jgi:hypothetical protein
VPESAVAARKLTARENRIYLSEEQDLYGFSEAVVNVNTYLSHDDVIVWPDTLKKETLPTSIVIVHEPIRSAQGVPYSDGERISTTGLVVRALMADGSEWPKSPLGHGIVPFGELSISPTRADASQAEQKATSELIDGMVSFSGGMADYVTNGGTRHDVYTGFAIAFATPTRSGQNREYCTMASRLPFLLTYYEIWADGEKHNELETFIGPPTYRPYVHNGYSAYYSSRSRPSWEGGQPENPTLEGMRGAAAWTVLYGDMLGGTQTITVYWPRYGDKKLLSTSFQVKVVPMGE